MNIYYVFQSSNKHGIGHRKRKEYINTLLYRCHLTELPINQLDKIPYNSIIITDTRKLNKKLVKTILEKSLLWISLDDVIGNKYASFSGIFSPLENLKPTPNIYGENLLIYSIYRGLGERREEEKSIPILVSMGGADPNRLTLKIASVLSKAFPNTPITVIIGPLVKYSKKHFSRLSNLNNIKLVYSPTNLKHLITKSDIVITSFGLTMYESSLLGAKTIVIPHSYYHYYLAQNSLLKNEIYLVKKLKELPAKVKEAMEENSRKPIVVSQMNNVEIMFRKYLEKRDEGCPICGSKNRIAIFRDTGISIFKCKNCRSVYTIGVDKEEYKEEYFVKKYSEKYGRSYEEDEGKIREMCVRRMVAIKKVLGDVSGKRLLDVGCGTGVFVDLATKEGFEAIGVDISNYAIDVARRTKEGSFFVKDFWELDYKEYFDVISMFFVAEHLERPLEVFEKLWWMLKPGGIAVLALPNGDGFSARFRPYYYGKIMPKEHIWEPSVKAIKILAKQVGFRILRIEYYGIHPERVFGKWILNYKCLYRFVSLLQKLLGLGDTMHIYLFK